MNTSVRFQGDGASVVDRRGALPRDLVARVHHGRGRPGGRLHALPVPHHNLRLQVPPEVRLGRTFADKKGTSLFFIKSVIIL